MPSIPPTEFAVGRLGKGKYCRSAKMGDAMARTDLWIQKLTRSDERYGMIRFTAMLLASTQHGRAGGSHGMKGNRPL